mmetsp:Transcript_24894/g.27705  ORF Transcript_24894/g.27705 Transcript_24894/m.27705 type:complete len:442 (+) Transcript_24894:38-1363(+)
MSDPKPKGTNGQSEVKQEKALPVVEPSGEYSVDEYIKDYSGRTKVTRLVFIAERCPKLQTKAYQMAIEELKLSQNTTYYRRLLQGLPDDALSKLQIDASWADAVDKKAAQQMDRLEHDLEAAKASLIKESIRVGNIELGNFFYERGDLQSSLRCYVRARDYCTSAAHIIEMCMHVIRVSIELGNFSHVHNYVSKAEQTADDKDVVTAAKLKVCSGLANLENRKYKQAAKKFIDTPAVLADTFTEVIVPRDVAVYGGLCGLATFSREEIKRLILDNTKFKAFWELIPSLYKLIEDFYNSRYASFLSKLEVFQKDTQLDIHLHDHIKSLYEKIRSKALVQYFSPFTSVDMEKMAASFKTSVDALTQELAQLIQDGEIAARIDSHNKRLYARTMDERTQTFEKAISLGDGFVSKSHSLLLRVNLVRNEFIVKPPRADKDKRRDK